MPVGEGTTRPRPVDRPGPSRGQVTSGAVGVLVLVVVAAMVAFPAPPATAQDKPGSVTFGANPDVDTELTATLRDEDTVSGTTTWTWAKSKRPDGTFTDLSGNGADTDKYTPQEADRGYFLRATANYTDSLGSGKTASRVTEVPAGVTVGTLVKNTTQTAESRDWMKRFGRDSTQVLRKLVTGNNPAGYVLSSIDVQMRSGTVRLDRLELWTPSGNTWSRTQTLRAPESLTAGAANTFTARTGTVLDADTEYFLVFVAAPDGPLGVSSTGTGALDSGAAQGWRIPDRQYEPPGIVNAAEAPNGVTFRGGLMSTQRPAPQIDVKGFELLGRPGPPGELTATATSMMTTLSWSAPPSLGHGTVKKYQYRHKATSQGEFTNSDMWTDVPDSADTGTSQADEVSVVVGSLTDGTRYRFQLRAVNTGDQNGNPAEITAKRNAAPTFSSTDYPMSAASRSVTEHATSGNVGTAITATDTDNTRLAYSVGATSDTGAAAHLAAFKRDFSLNEATGQISVRGSARIDYETRTSYVVAYRVTDGEDSSGFADTSADATLTLTINVTNADDPGRVTISPDTTAVGTALTASLSDPDTVSTMPAPTWKWSRSARPDRDFTDITTATSASYTPQKSGTVDDTAYFLRVTASYTDGEGSGKTASATTSGAVGVGPVSLVANIDRRSAHYAGAGVGSLSQRFRTGGNPAGYKLTSIIFRTNPWAKYDAAEIWSKNSHADRERSLLYTLRPLRNIVHAPHDAVLEPDTEYFVRLVGPRGINVIGSDDEDEGGDPGWSIANHRRAYDDSPKVVGRTYPESLRIGVNGFPLVGVPGPPVGFEANPASADSILLTWGRPAHDGQREVTKYQYRYKAGTLGDSDAWTDLTVTDVTITRFEVTITGLSDDTEYNAEVRAVNSIGSGEAATGQATTESGQKSVQDPPGPKGPQAPQQDPSSGPKGPQTPQSGGGTPVGGGSGGGGSVGGGSGSGGAPVGGGSDGGGSGQAQEPENESPQFTDVDPDDYYAAAVAWMVSNGITTGCATDMFCPDETATRAHFVTFLWRAAGKPEPAGDGAERFADVDPDDYYRQPAAWAAETGVTLGCGDGTGFCPHEPATRAQVAVFLYRHSGQNHAAPGATFRDVAPGAYSYQAVEWLVAEGITEGCEPDLFCPDGPATRAHIATFLYRYLTRQV